MSSLVLTLKKLKGAPRGNDGDDRGRNVCNGGNWEEPKCLSVGDWLSQLRWGAWEAQLVKCPTPDFGSGHDLTVHEIKPHLRLALTAWSLLGVLSLLLSLCPSPMLSLSLSLKINK